MGLLSWLKQKQANRAIERLVVERGLKRSSKWGALRKKLLAKIKACESCGSKVGLQVHHILPFHLAPDRELDENNVIVLCGEGSEHNCHFLFGHLGSWNAFNPKVRDDAARLIEKIKSRLTEKPKDV